MNCDRCKDTGVLTGGASCECSPVVVVFRKWNGTGDIIAIFPKERERNGDVMMYEHVGQHGSGSAQGVVSGSTPATPEDYAPLAEELRRIGYTLTIRQRCAR